MSPGTVTFREVPVTPLIAKQYSAHLDQHGGGCVVGRVTSQAALGPGARYSGLIYCTVLYCAVLCCTALYHAGMSTVPGEDGSW